MKRVSDLISLDDIKSWENGTTVLFMAGTGSGKTTFIGTKLNDYCLDNNKKILMLTNRKKLKAQIQQEFNGKKINLKAITFRNYQQIEQSLLHKIKIPDYDFVVFDEIHYLFSDSNFNNKTDLIADWLSNNNKCVKLLLSATGKTVERYFKNKNVNFLKYELEPDYSYIDNFYFYNDQKVIENLLTKLPGDEKAVYFSSIKKALKMSKEFKQHARFICSENNPDYGSKSDLETSEQIINNSSFDCQIVCATSVLDNGVNLIDQQIKHIIIDYFDLDTVVQMFGRRRIENKDDKINIYIRNRNGKSLNGTLSLKIKALEKAEYLKDNNQIEFVNRYQKNTDSKMIDDYLDEQGNVAKKVNEIMYLKHKFDIQDINSMLAVENGYIQKVLKRFNRKIYKILDDEFDAVTLESKLEKYHKIKLFSKDKTKFKDFINDNVIKVIAGSKGSLGYETINKRFEELELNYRIINKKETAGINKGKWYWMVIKFD